MHIRTIAALLCLLTVPYTASAEVTRVAITSRDTVAGGQEFGGTGPYERLVGTIDFAIDPGDPHNARIADLDRASKDADGRVHFTSDLYVLRPVDPTRGNGVLLFEIANRGRKGLLGRFNSARASDDPSAPGDFGNGFLLREGYTLVWVGWEFDIAPALVGVDAPVAVGISGPLSVRFIVNEPENEVALTDAPRYPPADPGDASSVLTVRTGFWDKATTIPRARWRFVPGEGAPRLALDGGFEPGRTYEVTYRATESRVAGVGLAAIRDAASAFRYRSDLPVSGRSAYIFGASQSGRFLREFLYGGFNADEQGRRAFDAVWPHIAGAARGSFNERFATPTSLTLFLGTQFPFTDETQTLDGQRGGLLSAYNASTRPKVFHTNTPVEYWGGGRAAALTHTSIDGKADIPVPDDVRIYVLAGSQHGEAAFPPTRTNGQQLANPVPQREVMRALIRGLHEWVSTGVRPPDSRYPRLSDRTLTSAARLKFPSLPGVQDPRLIPGPRRLKGNRMEPLPHLVPAVDADGNEIAGIRVPDLAVPLATTTGWNFRAPSIGEPEEIVALAGSYIPFPVSRAERAASGDPRPSIEERYRDRDDYLARLKAAALDLIRARYLLEEDLDSVLERGAAHWEFAAGSESSASQP
jgi:hypothetical protein